MPTPRTIACERSEDALAAFEELGGDVIVKPLFGSMGAGMTRVDDADVAYRVFEALALERAVYYLQEALPHDGRDLRALVVGGRVLAAIERVGSGWRANLARGARAQAAQLSAEQERLCLEAAAALGVDYAGVDLLRADGRDYVLELNGIPGWHGLQEATGFDVAAAPRRPRRGARQRSSASSRAPMTPLCRAVATSAPAAPAASSARRSSTSRTPPPASSSRSGNAAWIVGDQRDVRPRAAAHPREVEHDRLAQAGAVQVRHGRRAPPDRRAVRRATARRPLRRSTLRITAPEGSSASRRSSAAGPLSVSVPTMTRCAPRSSSARARAGSPTPASTMTRASRASAPTQRIVLAGPADRIEVGDVQLVEPQRGPERARQGQRVAVVASEGAADRAVAFALAAHGVDRRAVFEIDDRDDAHASDGERPR